MLRHVAERGGIAVYTRNLLDRMIAMAPDVRFVLLYGSHDDMGRYAGAANVVEALAPVRPPFGRFGWDQWQAPALARRYGADVLFNPKLSVPLRMRCPTVFMMPGLEQFAAPACYPWMDRLYVRALYPLYCRKAAVVLCMTAAGVRDLGTYLGVPAEKVRVVPASYNEACHVIADRRRLEANRARLGLPDRPYILFVGGITPLKNIPLLIQAFQLLRARGLPHGLVLAGFDRWGGSNDGHLVEAMGLTEHVTQLGFVSDEDLPSVYNLARCLVLPSHYEGFGLPILEAQACGCPVVISNVPPMIEVAGGAALVAEPDDAARLADRIAQAVTDGDGRTALIDAGFANVRKYSWTRTAERTLEVLRSLGHQGQPAGRTAAR